MLCSTLEASPHLSGPLHNQDHREMQKKNNISGFWKWANVSEMLHFFVRWWFFLKSSIFLKDTVASDQQAIPSLCLLYNSWMKKLPRVPLYLCMPCLSERRAKRSLYSCMSWHIPAASLAGEKRITSWQVRCGEPQLLPFRWLATKWKKKIVN